MMKKLLALVMLLGSLLYAVSTENILALTWQNGFCKAHPRNPACLNRHRGDYSLTNFTLHGLWPKKEYCKYKPMNLDKNFMKILTKFMPAARFGLAKHEWKKHGVCFGSDAKTYFLTAIKLTQQFNESLFRQFFVMHMGQSVSLARLRMVFRDVFGKSNVRKFQVICKNGYITEIRINLKGDPVKEDLYELINNAKEMHKKQCQRGIIALP
jgi:ribonuclease T2